MRRPSPPDLVATFLRWAGLRAAVHRGYWLVTSLYLVLDTNLTAFQLVFLGTAQGIVSLLGEVPAGVIADTISRKWSLVIAHTIVGVSMVATGLVTDFPALVVTQMLWGLGWNFASGADVAWITDELDQPERIAGVLAAGARWQEIGAAGGMIGFGFLAWAVDRRTAMLVAGLAMLLLGLYVAARFTEHRFTPTRARRWQQSMAILQRGVALARRDRAILLVLVTTFLINGAAEAFGRLYPLQLVALGLPAQPDPIVWFTALGITALVVGALALRIVEARIEGADVARRTYAVACAVGAVGLIVLGFAPNVAIGSMGVLLISGLALTVTRAVGVIWVNRRTTSDVRATVQSFLAQAEYIGEILCGLALAAIAQLMSLSIAFACACVLMAYAGALVARFPARER